MLSPAEPTQIEISPTIFDTLLLAIARPVVYGARGSAHSEKFTQFLRLPFSRSSFSVSATIATARKWARNGMRNYVDQTAHTDQDSDSTGKSIALS